MKRPPSQLHVQLDATGVAWVRLGAPSVGAALAAALCEAAAALEADEAVRVVVLHREGKDFCRGAARGSTWWETSDCVQAIGALSTPVIAGLSGEVAAEGCELALACDLRIAASDTALSLPQLSQGRLPSCGATQRLPRLIGRMRALDLLLSGRRVAAKEALGMGLLTSVVPPARLQSALRAAADELSRKGPLALRYVKEAVVKGRDMTFDQGMRLEEDLYVLLQTTADRREGIAAFLGKRAPRFVGK